MACNIKSPLIIFLILPLISRLNPCHILAQGKQALLSSRLHNAHLVMGSRPPRCDEDQKMCKNCGQCEAVQVPISPTDDGDGKFSDHRQDQQQQQQRGEDYGINSREDDISNYKPMCWKCKCGDFIFNP